MGKHFRYGRLNADILCTWYRKALCGCRSVYVTVLGQTGECRSGANWSALFFVVLVFDEICSTANVWNGFLDTFWMASRFRVGDGSLRSVVISEQSGKSEKQNPAFFQSRRFDYLFQYSWCLCVLSFCSMRVLSMPCFRFCPCSSSFTAAWRACWDR